MPSLSLKHLLWTMAFLGWLSGLLFIIHAQGSLNLFGLYFAFYFIAPAVPIMGLTALMYRRSASVVTAAGIICMCMACYYTYALGTPEMNQDANFGLGWYGLFGALFPLLPCWLFGVAVGIIGTWLTRRTPSKT